MITSLEAHVARVPDVENRPDSTQDVVVVVVSSSTGTVGIGETDSSPEIVKTAVDAPRSHSLAAGLRELLVGCDETDIPACLRAMADGTLYLGRRGVVAHAISAVEMALEDLRGRASGLPVWRTLAPSASADDGPRAYETALAPTDEGSLDNLITRVHKQKLAGLKLAWGAEGPPGGSVSDYLGRVRRQLGDDVELMVDLCCAGSEQGLIGEIDSFEEARVAWIEEPFRPDDLAAYERLAATTALPLAAGENESHVLDFQRLVDVGVRVMQPDVSRCGLHTASAIAAMARRAGLRCVPHAWSTGINRAATIHWAVAEGIDLVECALDPGGLAEEIARPNPRPVAGRFPVPTGAGLGVELNTDVLRSYAPRSIPETLS